jgi:hypothetical protein
MQVDKAESEAAERGAKASIWDLKPGTLAGELSLFSLVADELCGFLPILVGELSVFPI